MAIFLSLIPPQSSAISASLREISYHPTGPSHRAIWSERVSRRGAEIAELARFEPKQISSLESFLTPSSVYEHNRPDSLCVKCHPENAEKYVTLYEAKYGKKPPPATN